MNALLLAQGFGFAGALVPRLTDLFVSGNVVGVDALTAIAALALYCKFRDGKALPVPAFEKGNAILNVSFRPGPGADRSEPPVPEHDRLQPRDV